MSAVDMRDAIAQCEADPRERINLADARSLNIAAVYAMHDADGRIVYIGATNNLAQRIRQHRATAPWFGRVTSVSVLYLHPNGGRRQLAEMHAIRIAKPDGNRNGKTIPKLVASSYQFADAGRADSSFLLYVTVVLAAVFVAALTKPGQALAVLALTVTVGVVLRHVLAAHYRGVARVESARHRGVIR